MRRYVLSPRARVDLAGIARYVAEAAGPAARHPLAGSALVGVRLGIPGLRSFPVDGTPYVLFYLADSRRVDLVRVLHGRRDIDAELIEGVGRVA